MRRDADAQEVRRRRTGLAVVLAGALAALVAATGVIATHRERTASRIQLATTVASPFGVSLPGTQRGAPYLFSDATVCVTGPGTATIERVEPVADGGATATAFAARPLSGGPFADPETELARSGFGGSPVVSVVCGLDASNPAASLAVEVARGVGNGRVDGLRVWWRASTPDDHPSSGELLIPAHLVLCESADPDVPACQAL